MAILGVAATLFVLMAVENYLTARRYLQREAMGRAEMALDNTILRINQVLGSVEGTVYNLSHTVLEHVDSPDDFYDLTHRVVADNDFIYGATIAFKPNYYKDKGLYFAPYAYRQGDEILTIQLGSKDYDYHYMDWYQIARLLDKPYWNEPYYDEGGGEQIMTSYSYPIYDSEGEFIAIFAANVSLEWFAEQVNSIKLYPNSYNIMVGRGSRFLVHQDKDLILNETMFSMSGVRDDEDLAWTTVSMIEGKSGVAELKREDGQKYYLFYAPIEATGWSVAIACMHSEIFEGIHTMGGNSMLLAIVGVLLLSLLCFVAIRQITKPLTKFARSATEIAEGNFSAELPTITTKDEMYNLHNSFSFMQQSLRKHIDELKTNTATRERIESELRIARTIQMGMVPKHFPTSAEHADIDIYATLQPTREVGGDLYDFFVEQDKLYFIIGDVSGKGIPASLVMAVTCRMFRIVAPYLQTPAEIVARLNKELSENNDTMMFCTAFVGILNLKDGSLNYCNAGHNPPLVLSPGKAPRRLEIVSNLALGVWTEFDYVGQSCTLEPSETLLLYTDGVTEAESPNSGFYSEERLIKLLADKATLTSEAIVETVMNDVVRYSSGGQQSDDITLLCCHRPEVPKRENTRAITLLNNQQEIARMADFLDQEVMEGLGLDAQKKLNIHLALEEAVSNVINYAYPTDEEHHLRVEVEMYADRLVFKVIDSGVPFDPTQQADTDVSSPLEERPIGGLGIFLIRNIMQSVSYERDGENNVLTMIMFISN